MTSKIIEVLHHWPYVRGITGDQWFSLSKGIEHHVIFRSILSNTYPSNFTSLPWFILGSIPANQVNPINFHFGTAKISNVLIGLNFAIYISDAPQQKQTSSPCIWSIALRKNMYMGSAMEVLWSCFLYTARCCYNVIWHNMILHRALQYLRQNINQNLYLQNNPISHTYRRVMGSLSWGLKVIIASRWKLSIYKRNWKQDIHRSCSLLVVRIAVRSNCNCGS